MLVADGVSPARLSAEPALSKPRQLVGFSASSSSAVGCSARPRQLGVSRTPVLVTSVTASVLLRAASRRSQRALRCRRGGDSNVLRCAYGNNSLSRLSPLTDPSSWALVTGATTGLGQALARACLSAGYSVVLTERSDDRALQDLATKLRSEAGVQSDDLRLSSSDDQEALTTSDLRVVTVAVNFDDPTQGAAFLHSELTQRRGFEVSILLVASDQFSYTGPFLGQTLANLDEMLSRNVRATSALCRLFAADMAEAKRGRILLVGAPAGATPGVPGACAFAASMAFVRALADGLRQELADVGVGVSCLDSECLGREFGLDEALASTCVSFLSSSSSSSSNSNNNNYNNNNPRDNNSNNYNSNSNNYSNNNPYNNSNSYNNNNNNSNQRDSQRSSSSREGGDGGRRRNRRLEEQQEGPDPDLAWSGRAWQEAYQQLAVERNFTVLPFGAEIDRLQRSSLAELSNALLVGFAVFIYILERMPGISPSKLNVLHVIDDVPTALFFFDYVARWWSRGLKWDYALTPAMVFDLISVLPFLLRPFVPEFIGVELTFLKLLRVVRIYRFFRPKAFSDIVRVLLPPEEAESLTRMMQEMPPYQLQVVRTFGVVFTLVFITAGLCYEAEHRVNPQFGDIFSSIYFSLIALSTVGFGDIEPVTPAGRVAISICLVIGLCVIPAQASLVAAAVSEEQRRNEDSESVADADALLSSLEQAGAKLAWDAARIAELEDLERQERARIDELEQQATAWVAAKAKELLGLESSQPPGDDDAAAPEGEVDSSLTKVSESSSAENTIR